MFLTGGRRPAFEQKKPLEMAYVSRGLTEEENNTRGYKWHVSYPIYICNYHNVACQVFSHARQIK
jgi:hypothetical protein